MFLKSTSHINHQNQSLNYLNLRTPGMRRDLKNGSGVCHLLQALLFFECEDAGRRASGTIYVHLVDPYYFTIRLLNFPSEVYIDWSFAPMLAMGLNIVGVNIDDWSWVNSVSCSFWWDCFLHHIPDITAHLAWRALCGHILTVGNVHIRSALVFGKFRLCRPLSFGWFWCGIACSLYNVAHLPDERWAFSHFSWFFNLLLAWILSTLCRIWLVCPQIFMWLLRELDSCSGGGLYPGSFGDGSDGHVTIWIKLRFLCTSISLSGWLLTMCWHIKSSALALVFVQYGHCALFCSSWTW